MKHTVRILCIVLMAILICVGLAACEHKEAADHTATGDWLSDETHHWHACEKEECADAGDREEHVYDNACDAECNTCAYKRTAEAHAYDNACDASCNECGATRTITHAHGTTLTAGDTTHYYACSVCGDKKDEAAHVFDKTVASSEYLKEAATATTKAQYWKSCVCGKASSTEYFETDKAPANLQVADISKTYDGTPVSEPVITFDGVGGEGFEYWQGTTKLSGKPTNAGTYKVVVTVGETETHAGDRVEREFTIAKKTLNYLEVTKVYNGKRGFGENAGIYCQLGIEHGVIAGDTVFLETSDDFEYNVGKYYFVRMNSTDDRDTVWLHGDDAANYDFQGNDVVGEVTVTPKVLSNLTFSVVYNGSTYHADVAIPNGVVAGDEFLVDIDLYNKGAGTYTCYAAGKETSVCWEDITPDGADYENYEVDRATATVTVTPKALKLLDIEVTYDGGIISSFDLTAADGIVAGDDVYLSGDGWQNYDVAYDEYTLTDDLSSDDYDEGVWIGGADKANYKFTYDTDGSVGKVTVLPYILDFTGEYVKDADGTHYVTFTKEVTFSGSDTETVTVKLPLLDLDGQYITNAGVYTQENAQFGPPEFYVDGGENLGYDLDDSFYATESEFKVTVLSTDDLIMQVTNKNKDDENFILVVEVKQGTVKVGDSIVLTDTSDKVYEVLAIEKFGKPLEFATVGDEVGLYVSGMTDLAEVPGASFLYEKDNVPKRVTEFLAEVYLKTKDEGGRQQPISSGYKPSLVGLGASQEVELTIIDVYNSDEDFLLAPGGTARVKVTLTTPLPACLLETAEFSLLEVTKHVGNVDNVDLIPYDSFAKALVVDCDTAHSETMQVYVGQKVYVKMELHEIDTQQEEDAVLSTFSIKATTGSAATFTGESYKNNTTTTYETVTTATAQIAMEDLTCWADGDYFYYVITCVTAGEISIIVE